MSVLDVCARRLFLLPNVNLMFTSATYRVHTPLTVAALALVGALLAQPVHAQQSSEIQYGSLKDQRGNTLLLEYKGPAGTQYFSCSVTDVSCKAHGSTTPALFPAVLGTKDYTRSSDGTLGVRPFSLGTLNYYFLYDIRSDKPKKLALIPYLKPGANVSLTKNNDAVMFKDGLTYTRYDIATKKMTSVTLSQNLAFMSVSPSGTYVTGYNYGSGRHELWNARTGGKSDGPSAMQSYLEFSEDEARVAFLEDVQGFRTLMTAPLSEVLRGSAAKLVQVTKPKTETEDYLFIGGTLYFMANVDGPLEWDLFAYDAKVNKIQAVDQDVSYGDFLKRVRAGSNSQLAYLKTDGKNTNVVLVAPGKEKTTLKPVPASPISSKITRTVASYGGRTGVMLAPSTAAKKDSARDLFIWMHGGPMRQIAKGYHPYLSYAVYDELLERLAEGGSYVYKIDYSGSTGYGSAFRNSLKMKVGDTEIKDIKNAIAAIKKEKKVRNVYLIGNSYGGYMAFRGIVDMPETVDGAVSIAGVSDWYGLISQIPTSPFKDVFDGVPDNHNMDAYLKASVFTGMDKLDDDHKVLVVWGENDSTVPVWQSTKYLEFAKTQDFTVDSLSFPDEDHILRKRSNLDKLCNKVTSFLGVKAGCKI